MKYKTIVIDPPWDITLSGPWKHCSSGLGRGLPYKTMTDKQVRDFPIDDFADTDCKLYCWTTTGKLEVAMDIMRHWGFPYKTCFVWVKNHGPVILGTRYNAEYVLFGYRGKFGQVSCSYPMLTAFQARRGAHSAKPATFFEHLVRITDAPRIEIFARKRRPGWDAWGDQVQGRQPVLSDWGGSTT